MAVAKMKCAYFTAVWQIERQFLILSERIYVSTNSRKTKKVTTYGTCRHQIVKMMSRSLFLFPVYKRHFVFLRWSSICVGHMSYKLGAPKNVGIAAGISQICYSYQNLFLCPV